jgi:hypothetical protein
VAVRSAKTWDSPRTGTVPVLLLKLAPFYGVHEFLCVPMRANILPAFFALNCGFSAKLVKLLVILLFNGYNALEHN